MLLDISNRGLQFRLPLRLFRARQLLPQRLKLRNGQGFGSGNRDVGRDADSFPVRPGDRVDRPTGGNEDLKMVVGAAIPAAVRAAPPPSCRR